MKTIDVDLKEALGANDAPCLDRFAIYLPNKDDQENPVPGFEQWVESALYMMAEINGGTTKLPAAEGLWRGDHGGVVREDTNVIYSFLRKPASFEANLERIKIFLHSYGKFASQGEVMAEFTGTGAKGHTHRSYFITEYPDASEDIKPS